MLTVAVAGMARRLRGLALAHATAIVMIVALLPAGARAPSAMAHGALGAAGSPGRSPIDAPGFEPNVGQAAPQARFVIRLGGLRVALTDSGLAMTLADPPATPSARSSDTGMLLGLRLLGANRHPRITGEARLPGTVNYVIGPEARAWHEGIPTFARVRYHGVYPGVDLVYRATGGHLEYDFIVAPGADPSVIRMAFTGTASETIDAAGDMLVRTARGTVVQKRPAAYQQLGGSTHAVAVRYQLLVHGQIRFHLGVYDQRVPLVIDPLLVFASEFGLQGGGGDDEATGVKVDAAGNAFVVGTTTSGLSHKAMFVTKLDPTGRRPLYATIFSGDCESRGGGIDLDARGNAYVTGLAISKDENGICAVTQVVVARLSATGKALYVVGFGGHQDLFARDWGNGITVDRQGNAYVTGDVEGDSKFPTTPGAFMARSHGFADTDAFALKVDPNGKLVYSTLLGGTNLDHGNAIAVDARGQAWVTGQTSSKDFPVTPNAYQKRLASSSDLGDVFVTELNATGSALLYSTYLGGMSAEAGNGIAVDAQGHAYVAGATGSPDFPTTAQAFNRKCGLFGHCGLSQDLCALGRCPTFDDAFVAEIDADPALPARSTLRSATYLGGTTNDSGVAVAVDAAHHVYVAGRTQSRDFPMAAATQPARGGAGDLLNTSQDAFVAKLDLAQSGAAALMFSTYLGGTRDDVANGIALGRAGTVFVAGVTSSTDFPASGHLGGPSDAFLAKIDTLATGTVVTTPSALPAIDRVAVCHPVAGKWVAATLIHRSEQTFLAVFFRAPKNGSLVTGRLTLTYHGKWSQTFALTAYPDTQGLKVLGLSVSWLPDADNLGRIHATFTLNTLGAQVTRSTDFTLAA